MSLTPEQILALRPVFETKIKGAYTYPESQVSPALSEDGFQYIDPQINMLWEGFLQGVEYAADNDKAMAAYSSVKKPSEFAEDLRKIRAHSKCFTTAYDRKMPSFTLIAQDSTAHMGVAMWIKANIDRLGESHPKIIAAKATMGLFMEWPNKKDAD